VSASIPSGTVTFVFTDIEGSTKLLQELGDDYASVVRDHRRLVRDAFTARGGAEVDTQGDAFFFSFPRARDAVAAAVDAQRALAAHAWPQGTEVRVRMGLHTGEPTVGEEGYLGLDVVRAARIAGAGHGGQILISETTRALLGNQLPDGAAVHDLGEANLKDVQHEHIYQVSVDEEHRRFPPLKTEHPKSAGEALAERIHAHDAEQIEQSFANPSATKVPQTTKLAAVGLLNLVLLAATIIVIVLLVKIVF
jgi:class 3 adenylate cyclase